MKILFLLIILIFTLSGCSTNETNEYGGETLYVDDDAYKWTEAEKLEKSDKIKEFLNIKDKKVNQTEQTKNLQSDDNTDTTEVAEYIPPSNIIGSYSTKILTTDSNRYNNISIVADRLNGYVLAPGAEFSYNKVCGPYGKDDGFLEANILLSDGTEVKGFGGGVCQLSTTLYNAIKDLNVEITEHHHHSKPVAYAPINQDATVSLQSNLDFKFKNNYNKSIKFETWKDSNNLSVSVYLQ